MSPISVKQQLLTAFSPRSKLWGGHSTAISPSISSSSPPHYIYQRRLAGLNESQSSPFDKIPFELFVEIFSHCPNDFPRIDAQVAPVTLALVCHTWYDLVMKTPRLWSCFEVILEGIGTVENEMIVLQRHLKGWLKRSCNQPLSFRIIHKSAGRTHDLRAAELFNLLLPYANRWQDVQFHGPSGSLAHLPLKLQNGLPLLTSLSVRLSRSWDSSSNFSQFNIPWSQITRLDLQFYEEHLYSLDECYKVLSAARNLVSCTLNANCILTLDGDSAMERLALPSLKSLHLILQGDRATESSEKSLLAFLERLALTDLSKFNVEWLIDHTENDVSLWDEVHPRFIAFIHSFSHSIQSLGLSYLPLTDQKLIGCLRGLNNLTALDLKFSLTTPRNDPITEEFLHYIMPLHSSFSLHRRHRRSAVTDQVPLLKILKLQCSGENFDSSLLLDVLEVRTFNRCLKEFGLVTMKSMSWEFHEHLMRWRNEGRNYKALNVGIR